jgi:hypothetical protein
METQLLFPVPVIAGAPLVVVVVDDVTVALIGKSSDGGALEFESKYGWALGSELELDIDDAARFTFER